MAAEAARISIWNALLASVADEMGIALGLTGHSPNIRERRDYSCAVFDAAGAMVAQAAHIPVHLGAMPEAVRAVSSLAPWAERDVAIVNDPFLGGTHLPDVSLVAPVFWRGEIVGFVTNRAHHADIGGMSAGSMPVATELLQEGIVIPPLKLFEAGRRNDALFALIVRNTRSPAERRGDFAAQVAAIRTGESRLRELCERYGGGEVRERMAELQLYAERLTRAAITAIADGDYAATDVMELPGGGFAEVRVLVRVRGSEITFDFAGTAPDQDASINAVAAVTRSAVAYVVRCLLPAGAPSNDGCFRPITTLLPEGSLVNASSGRAVSAGNVETSQRITDVCLRALADALPNVIPASSAGSMTNFTFGGRRADGSTFAYYATIPGGAGAGPSGPGTSAIQTHMTNTANTPVEAIEDVLPVRIWTFAVRDGSGGDGLHRGGDGVLYEVEFRERADVSMIADRRIVGAPGLARGEPGSPGRSTLVSGGAESPLSGSFQRTFVPGERLRIETPGGGGWGLAQGQ